jgi:outer membrane protein assembly factor BamB
MKLKPPHVYLLLMSLLAIPLLAACSGQKTSWAGLSTDPNTHEIFVAYDDMVAKLSPDGQRIWSYPERPSGSVRFFAPPTLTEGVVYVGDYRGGVHAIDRETGEGLWVYEQTGTEFLFFNFGGSTDRVIGPVTVRGDRVYVPNEEGVFVLDRGTGARSSDWVFKTGRPTWGQPLLIAGEAGEEGQAGQADRLIVSSLDQRLYALNADTADIIWETYLDGAVAGSPLYDPERQLLFIGTFAAELFAIDATTGEIQARYATEGWLWEAPAMDEAGLLYLGDMNGYLYALRYAEGQFSEVWKTHLAPEAKFRATPLIQGDVLLIGSDRFMLYSVRRSDGGLEWDEDFGRELISPVLFVQGEDNPLIVTATEERKELVLGVRLDNGEQRWVYEHRKED